MSSVGKTTYILTRLSISRLLDSTARRCIVAVCTIYDGFSDKFKMTDDAEVSRGGAAKVSRQINSKLENVAINDVGYCH